MREIKFSHLAEVFGRLEKTASSLAMIDILAEFFPKISPEEAKISAYLLRGELSPPYEGLEIGLAEKMVIRGISRLKNMEIYQIARLYQKTGDLGVAVEELKKGEKSLPAGRYGPPAGRYGLPAGRYGLPAGRQGLTIKEVFEKLIEIAKTGGEGSQEKKINLLADLLSKASAEEAKYIIRTVLGTLRLGVGEMIFLYGLAKAFGAGKKDKEVLEYAFNVLSDLGEVAYIISRDGLKGIMAIKPKVGAPIRMMSSNRIKELDEVKKHIEGVVSVEDKYDGERIQAHIKKNGETSLFSRRQEKITHQYPDIISGLKKYFRGKEAIIEGEVVAYDEKNDKLLPFQILMSRRRKHNIEEYVKKIPVRYFLFDLLYLDGENYLNKSLKERRIALERFFQKIGVIDFGKYALTDDLSEIESYFGESVKRGNEGVMIKDWSGIYRAGSRGWLWIKFKKDYRDELTDTFDLVVVGALYGAGRRAGTYGSLLAAVYDPKINKYYSFTKVGTGFTDEVLAKLLKMFEKYKIKEKHKLVETNMKVDVWFEPKIVMEVSGAEITVSPVHTAARDKIEKALPAGRQGGLALRFPRFLRWRDDKSAENATTTKEIFDIYKLAS
ncbi:MAG: ATP-dependent DNA ligase [Patescibacteria group bacterium]